VFIPESKRLNVLLRSSGSATTTWRSWWTSTGGVSGLLTIEDVLEQIVGDIGDEYDVDESEGIRREGERTFSVPALTRIEDFNEAFGTRFSDEEFDTSAGSCCTSSAACPAAARRSRSAASSSSPARRPAPHRDPARHHAGGDRVQVARGRLRTPPDGATGAGTVAPGCSRSPTSSPGAGSGLRRPQARRWRSLSHRPRWWRGVPVPGGAVPAVAGRHARSAAWRGFLFTGGTFLAGTYWLYHSIHLVGGAPLWIAAFLMLGLVAIMGSYTAALGYAAARWGVASGARRWLLLLPAGWVLVEWFRGWFLSGFPWLALGYTQLETPLAGVAPVAACTGTSLAVGWSPVHWSPCSSGAAARESRRWRRLRRSGSPPCRSAGRGDRGRGTRLRWRCVQGAVGPSR